MRTQRRAGWRVHGEFSQKVQEEEEEEERRVAVVVVVVVVVVDHLRYCKVVM